MKYFKFTSIVGLCLLALLCIQCDEDVLLSDEFSDQNAHMKSSKAKSSDGETAGNNLSYPVIWSDGASIALRGERWLAPKLEGEWWYVWGEDPIDPQAPLYSCQPNPADSTKCLDGTTPGDGGEYWKAFVQKDPLNEWQAWNYNGANDPVWEIDLIDWGDNLESVDWTIASQVRTEIVLYEPIPEGIVFLPGEEPWAKEYAMRHAYGWGISEVHGLQAYPNGDPLPPVEGNPATVYSPNARLTIQKINVENLDEIPAYSTLEWDPDNPEDPDKEGWVDRDIFSAPLFNMAVYEGGDGPGYYSAEVNVKGKIIYGYTWNVKRMNEGVGYYRITFSFDDFGPVTLNTEINGTTEIIVPIEEEILAAIALAEEGDDGGDTGGATPVIDEIHNLTYIDVLITEKERGAGGGNGGGKTDNPGDGSGGGKDDNLGRGKK